MLTCVLKLVIHGSTPSSTDIGFEDHAAFVAANANSNSTGVSLPSRR